MTDSDWAVPPTGTGTQHPEDSVENGTAVFPWATATVVPASWLWDQRIEGSPLQIGKITRIVHLACSAPIEEASAGQERRRISENACLTRVSGSK